MGQMERRAVEFEDKLDDALLLLVPVDLVEEFREPTANTIHEEAARMREWIPDAGFLRATVEAEWEPFSPATLRCAFESRCES